MLSLNARPTLGLIPSSCGIFHIIGIGGIGMSAIAQILNSSGYKVQGSDLLRSSSTDRLQSQGISCFIGTHTPKNLEGVRVVIHSTAIKEKNPELIFARQKPDGCYESLPNFGRNNAYDI